jgi:hypothetical protein
MPRRMSVWPTASHTRTPDGTGIIGATNTLTAAAANAAGIEPGIRTRAFPTATSIAGSGQGATSFAAAFLVRCNQHLGKPGRTVQFLPPAIDLACRNIGAPRHLRNHRPRRKTHRDDRSLLILAQLPPTLRADGHPKSRHRTAVSPDHSLGYRLAA